jgi:hypothetical protein
MRKLLLLLFILSNFVLGRDDYYKNRILFCMNKDISALGIEYKNKTAVTNRAQLNELLNKYQVVKLGRWLTAAKEYEIDGDVKLVNIYRAEFTSDKSWDELQNILNDFRMIADIHSAHLEGIHRIVQQTDPYTPNDPRFNEQWWLTKIMADYAWGLWGAETPGDTTVLIGIVDTGVDYEHPELENVLFWNLGEDANGDGKITSADENGVDDDGNGFVDDFRGWDFVGSTESLGAHPDNDVRPPDAGPNQELSHGTHVGGITAATVDNGIGVASVSYRSKIIVTKHAYDDDLTEPGVYYGYDGIEYCAQMGAHIINCSWGGSGYNPYAQNVINNVVNTYGCIIVCAAGNDGTDNDLYHHYPSDYDNTIGVAALTIGDTKAEYSNYGSCLDISAPGGSGYTSATGILSTIHYNAGEYASWPGTSMSSPVVAGSFALVKAFFPEKDRDWLIDAVLFSADTIDYINPGYEGELGTGRVNVYHAIAWQIYPYLTIQSYDYSVIDDNGDGQLNPGESAYLNLTIENNENWIDADNVSVTLSSTSSDVSFPDPNAEFGNIPAGSSASNSSDDLIFEVSTNSKLDTIPIIVTIRANQTSSYPYEVEETIEVLPSMNQAGFPITITAISAPVGCDSILSDSDKEIIFIGENDSLYVYDADGSIASGFPVYIGYTSCAPIVADVDNDNQKEIVIINRNALLRIFEINGSILLEKDFDEDFRGDAAVANMDSDANLEIVFGTRDRKLHIVKIDGTELSEFPLESSSRIIEGVALADLTGNGFPEIVFGNYDDELLVVTALGDTLTNWPIALSDRITASPIIASLDNNYHIFVATRDDTVLRINVNGTIEAKYSADDDINSYPAVCDINDDDLLEIFFGTDDGKLHAIDFSGNSIEPFPLQLDGSISTSPVFADFGNDNDIEIIIGTEAGKLYILNKEGSNYSNFPAMFEGHLDGSPCVADVDNDGDFEVIIGGDNGLNVLDINADKGYQDLWQTYLANNRRTGYYKFQPTGSGIDNRLLKPIEYNLLQNYPNPFNPETMIEYSLASNSTVELLIYNLLGQKVRTLVSGVQPIGVYKMNWDGKNDNGKNVVSGIYIYQIKMKGKDNKLRTMTKKMLLIK